MVNHQLKIYIYHTGIHLHLIVVGPPPPLDDTMCNIDNNIIVIDQNQICESGISKSICQCVEDFCISLTQVFTSNLCRVL
jgi:hypothetical protein